MPEILREKPISPHLGIYRPQISSVLSILHRMSGVSNFLGLLALAWWLVFTVSSPQNPSETRVWEFFSSNLGNAILILWSFGVFFHFCTGIRHLAWDAGLGFELKVMKKTGYISVFMAVLLTAITWCVVLLF
jgi:succinate dehydrogenase / fumarate reductase cytochrome b subunit